MANNILIVDSDKAFSAILSEGLNTHAAFSAAVVGSSSAALKFVVDKSVDLVIVDMSIGDTPTQKLVKALRKAKANMPVMITPIIGQDVPENVKALGIQGILPKPFFVGDLPKIVGDALGLSLDSQIPELSATKPAEPERPLPSRSRPVARRGTRTRRRIGDSQRRPELANRSSTFASVTTAAGAGDVVAPTLSAQKLERLHKSQDEIINHLQDMNRDFPTEVILLTAGSELIAKVGSMKDDQARELAVLVAKGAEAAAQSASFLGERAGRFEQSLHEGTQYRLYSYSLGEGVVLSIALSTRVPLGILRHQTRRISQKLMKDYIN